MLQKGWGIYLFISGVALLINRASLKSNASHFEDQAIMNATGLVYLIVGVATILLNNVWSADIRFVITVLGWIALAKGALRLIWPKFFGETTHKFMRSDLLLLYIALELLLGTWLIFTSFSAI